MDTKNQVMNVCTEKSCRAVPHEVNSTFVPGMQPTYGQMPMMPTNSLGIVENTTIPGFGCGNGVYVMPAPQQAIQLQQQAQRPNVVIEDKPEIEQIVQPQQPVRVAPMAVPPQRIVEQGPPPLQTFRSRVTPVVQKPMMMPQPPVMTVDENTEPEKTEEEAEAPGPIRPLEPMAQTRPVAPPNPMAENRVNNDIEQLDATEQKLFGR